MSMHRLQNFLFRLNYIFSKKIHTRNLSRDRNCFEAECISEMNIPSSSSSLLLQFCIIVAGVFSLLLLYINSRVASYMYFVFCSSHHLFFFSCLFILFSSQFANRITTVHCAHCMHNGITFEHTRKEFE